MPPLQITTINDNLFNAWALLRRTSDIMERARNKELSGYNINLRQAAALHLITVLKEKATPTFIARLEMRQPHTVCHILQTMENQGLVIRRHDLDRKNKVRAALTEKGKKAYYLSQARESIHRIMSCLSPEEIEQLNILLKKLTDAGKKEFFRQNGK
jgi:DNA-binding MarR family transcriptional regulator